MTTARAQEVALGMYSLRSFMLPHLIALFMIVVDRAGIAVSPFLVGNIVRDSARDFDTYRISEQRRPR